MSDDISSEELMDKYGLVMDGNRRYYKESLLKRDFYLENTTPYRFKIRDRVFEETSWGELRFSNFSWGLSVFGISFISWGRFCRR